ncbi:unnamed protein product [Rhizoctonia solani]|uniref:F-box domain-containing protein n=1 Tax=Rhizoctonia solani TaxID=456999 RepID=A0A8H3D8K1_9AGAM|nr:unnamed protein product [Rhizoctonia solani]
MLYRDAPFGLARYRGLAEPFRDPQPRIYTASGAASRHPKAPNAVQQSHGALLPEDIMVIVIAYLSVADILVVRRCNKWLRYLTEDRHIWLNFLLQPTFPAPECVSRVETMPSQELEAQVRRQFELSRRWTPRSQSLDLPIRPLTSRRLAMPNNEFLTAIASMDSWVAVASDLGGVYLCTPFGENYKGGLKWIRVWSLAAEIIRLCVDVSNGRVSVMWVGRALEDGTPSYRCGVVSALVEDLLSAQSRAQGGILLNSSDFVTSITFDLRNPASEIMDIAIGERYCAVVDAAHIFQVFIHRPLEDGMPPRSEFQGPHRSSRKTISLQFLPYDQLLVYSDSFIAIYKPVTPSTTTMERKYWTHVPTETFFGLLTHRRSSNITSSGHMRIPILAFSGTGKEITHYDLRVPCSEPEGSEIDDYGLTHRRSVSYILSTSLDAFSMGTINGGCYRMAWVTMGAGGQPFGIALGRISLGNYDPSTSYQAPLDRALIDLGDYKELIMMQSPLGPLFAFHEGEGVLFGGVRKGSDLVMLQY